MFLIGWLRKKIKKLCALIAAVLVAFTVGTNDSEDKTVSTTEGLILSTTESESTASQQTLTESQSETEKTETYIILADEMTTINGKGASFSDGQVTVNKGGVYHIKGSLKDGRISVNLEKDRQEVELHFYGVSINSTKGAPISVENSPEDTVIYLAEGTVNEFSDSSERIFSYVEAEEDTAVIFSKDDLSFEGEGKLSIKGNFNKGIYCKKNIAVKDAVISIQSADDGIRGNDSITLKGAKLQISAGGDGIRTNDDTEDVDGKIVIHDSEISVESSFDGIESAGDMLIYGGKIDITSAGGSTGKHEERGGPAAFGNHSTAAKDKNSIISKRKVTRDSSAIEALMYGKNSSDGMRAEGEIVLSDASLRVSSAQNGIYANSIQIESGHYSLCSDGDGLYAADEVEIDSGDVDITDSYDGIKACEIELGGGKVLINAYNNGFCIHEDTEEEYGVEIDGAYVHLDCNSGGKESSSKIEIAGGTLIVFDSSHKGVSSDSYHVSSGTLLVLSDVPVGRNVTSEDVPVLTFTHPGVKNVLTVIADSKGDSAIGFCSPKRYVSVVFASDSLDANEYYSLYGAGSFDGEAFKGVYTSGNYSGGKLLRKLSKPLLNLDKTG